MLQVHNLLKQTDIESQYSKKTGNFGVNNTYLKKSDISVYVDTDQSNHVDKYQASLDNQDYQMMINQSTDRSNTNSILKFQTTRESKISSMKYLNNMGSFADEGGKDGKTASKN